MAIDTDEDGNLLRMDVRMPDGTTRRVFAPAPANSDKEADELKLLKFHAARGHEAAEWQFQIRLAEHLEAAGYSGGKGWGNNSWWYKTPKGGMTLGYHTPMLAACEEHCRENAGG